MTKITELAHLAAERRQEFATTLAEIKSRSAFPAFAVASLAFAAALAARQLTTKIAARLARHQ